MRDLVVVVPDKGTEQALTGLLKRPESMGVRTIDFIVRVHPQKDPGCYHTGHELAATSRREASHALVVFDRAWEGAPSTDAAELQREVEARLRTLWGDQCACIVIDPELEAWVWSDSLTWPRPWDGRGASQPCGSGWRSRVSGPGTSQSHRIPRQRFAVPCAKPGFHRRPPSSGDLLTPSECNAAPTRAC